MIRVEYIGQKARKIDNVANTATVWHGFGDIQTVTPEVWAKLKVHATIWREAPAPALQTLASAQVVTQAADSPQVAVPGAAAAPAAPQLAALQVPTTGDIAPQPLAGAAPQANASAASAAAPAGAESEPPPAGNPEQPQHKFVLILQAEGKETPVVLDTMELDALKAFNTQHKLGVDNRTKDPQRFRELLFAAATAEA